MATEHTSETHLGKDELLEILNEIDTERQNDPIKTNDHQNESTAPHSYPNPSNQFY
ncbi:MAG: hypothetical protein HUN04_02795 [Desulfobacter sp.]|nr:MAG: hypothetical protein HUN04_02795 [Desulfobacter sp.]